MVSPGIKTILLLIAAMCMSLTGRAQDDMSSRPGNDRLSVAVESLREGDLLFCSPDTANAITAVTCGVDGLSIDHVAVVHRMGGDEGDVFVIEAVKPAVRLTPIGDFMADNGTILQARVQVDCDIEASVNRCLALVGTPYDDLYLPGDSAIYCSELVQMCFVNSSDELIFGTIPMSFHDQSGNVTEHWKEFYSSRGMNVPEGRPGTNPGELSRRPQIEIIGKIWKRL